MASCTSEKCSLHRQLPVYCPRKMVGSGYGIRLVSSFLSQFSEKSGPRCWWDYGIGRHKLWTVNTGAFYWLQFERTERFCVEILWPIVLPFILHHHLMLEDDNAQPHVASISTQFLEAENIPLLAWPYSQDISGWRVQQWVLIPSSLQQLGTAIEEDWTIYLSSMPHL